MKSDLTVAEALLVSGKKKSALYEWMADGSLPYEDSSEGRIIRYVDLTRVMGMKRPGRPRGSSKHS